MALFKLRTCSCCKVEKLLVEFPKRTDRINGTRHKCTMCYKAGMAEWRRANPESNSERNRRAALRHRRLVFNYLLKHPCVDCGEGNPLVLDFDHIKERGKKLYNVAEMRYKCRSVKKLFEEIAKCEVRCSNCHRKKTAERDPRHWSHSLMAGSPGVEPRQGESKSPVLPLHHEPIELKTEEQLDVGDGVLLINWWTVGESNSRLPDANRRFYH